MAHESPPGNETGRRCITAIKTRRGNTDELVLQVNHKSVATLSTRSVANLGLAVGRPWDETLATRVREAAQFDHAFSVAMRVLNRRARSTQQLTQLLRLGGHNDPVILRVTQRLTELNLLDDDAFGQALIRDTLARSPAGPRLLRSKLLQRGVDRQLADQLVDQSAASPDLAITQATHLAQKRIRSLHRPLEPSVLRRRLWGLLARRGFDSDTIDAALSQAMGSTERPSAVGQSIENDR